ncbi:MAG: HAD-IA family hydrolase, partial [Chloroflexota bacterium]|nr:HAD-IA family hydrolase [Chloroflexota bacterium]
YRKLTLAVRLVRAGAAFIGPNPDTTLPMHDGIIPGAGSFQAAIRAATGVSAVVIGKPEPTMFLMGAERLGLAPAEVAMLGDRLDTDIVGAKRAGLAALMVLTGVSRLDDVERSPEKPDRVFADLADVQAALVG